MTVYAVLNQKGGVGKTTLTLNLAYEWSRRGLRVLVVDVDKQAAATTSLLAEEPTLDAVTIVDVLSDGIALDRAVTASDSQWGSVELVPASLDLEDVWTSTKPGLVFRLRRALDEADVHNRYDRVLLDGPPDLGPGTVAACVASDQVIVPTRPERMALHGVARTREVVDVVRRDMRPDVELAGIIPVAVDPRVTEHTYRLEELRRIYGDQVTQTVLPHRLKSDEASGAGRPAALLDGPAGDVFAQAYADLCTELDKRSNQ